MLLLPGNKEDFACSELAAVLWDISLAEV